ncbi:transcriptional regulator [Salmonella enterica]|uniref:Transcriptional regulator n=1 Tax=Salmonella enterica subsp. enterica serovar Paratyphi B str. CFSAN000540 TaxID=1299076 RepID=A0A8E6KK09_SALEB|nr:transcriptional regulator [Salmonella enterica]EDU6028059.1 transcriptional regulator [Salmonella enterica subsp. enterica serovar Brazil]QVQ07932.1 transcriptional regulator [Salmonella enterica subsp. enterica serovar Paratyphi B str. CFSAN000540]EBH5053954.1 transcriptional regulator [Salmonella enterica]EBN7763373.1 transcriptional regulator [Salmonella enterica]
MKTYIINSNCIYNEGKYELRTVSNSQVIKMTAMRAKCLSFIIENAHLEIIERQKITTALWGSRSHYVNDANLTQILYLIRRDLKALGINDLFITIPRQGLKVNSDIAIIATDSETKGRKKQIVRHLTTVFSVTLGSLMYLHIH